MAEEGAELVAGDDGWISDESSFYGDDHTNARLEKRISRLTPPAESSFWTVHSRLPSVIAYNNRNPPVPTQLNSTSTSASASASDPFTASDPKAKGKAPLYLPHEGQLAWRQSHESAADFVSRLPPATTSLETAKSPWIWVNDPLIDRYKHNHFDKDELIEKGEALLDEFRSVEAKTRQENPGKSESVIGRKLGPLRRKLEEDLKKCAINVGCLSGKWMLFPATDCVNEVWQKVCTGVIGNRLGPIAKVAVAGNERDNSGRIICVYTKDFSDDVDVRRVLDAMLEMGLVDEEDAGNGVYYKCDAYTYWGIESGNEFKVKASLYGSKEMLRRKVVDEQGGGGKRRKG